ncbi:MAG: hypothetical protein UY48_C0018G0001 [Candidatus Gottesmanbacteria bacterium GW2011_GWB1_49_7]|uniref:Uncharacterized protein n=1 Tax=Candidatus Gottesmanbacteria bacterium GW2011_GWB1_49_7 TaxID=1618448 RepID=A0A0G1Y985_9BACT|nr:MAG: hypothetical protein UY48_C0018G0001 [Candidatus Gottesmanbacteria bacterium GW2011_GWB1_49_7]
MATEIKITGLDELKKNLIDAVQDKFPLTMAIALTKTAKDIQAAEIEEMKVVFNRPTPWALGGTWVDTATKEKLVAVVKLKDEFMGGTAPAKSVGTPAIKFLEPQIMGGERHAKRFELALRYAGVLPDKMFIVPGKGAEIDQYGNMTHGLINQLIAWFRTSAGVGYGGKTTEERKERLLKGTKKKAGYEYVFFRTWFRGRQPGIYRKSYYYTGAGLQGSLLPIAMFVKKPMYKKRFDFFGIGNKVADTMLQHNFALQMEETLKRLNGQ